MMIISLLLLQVLIFAALIITLRRMLTRNIVSATRHLDELNQNYTKKEEEANRQLEEARGKVQDMMAKAAEEVENLKIRIVRESNNEADEVLKKARAKSDEIIEQADRTRQHLLSEIDEKIANEAIDRACELIHHTLPEQFKRDAHSQRVEELIRDGFAQLEGVRLPPDAGDIKIVSAFVLNDAQRKSLSGKLKEVLKRDIKVKEEIDPKIITGIIINIGSLVLDGSLKNKIQEEARKARHGADRQ